MAERGQLVSVYRPIAAGYTVFIGLYYLALTPAHLIYLHGYGAWSMAALALGTAIYCFSAAWLTRCDHIRLPRLEALTLALNLLVMANVSGRLLVSYDSRQMDYFPVILLGYSIVSPSLRVLLTSIGSLILSSLLLAHRQDFADYGFIIAVAAYSSLIASILFRQTVSRQIRARIEAERLGAQLAEAGALNRRLAEEAAAANAAKTRFLANMSHELRTPLNGVIAVAELLGRTPLDLRQTELLDLITSSGKTLEALLSEILDLSRIESGRMELDLAAFSPAEAVATVTRLLAPQGEAKEVAVRLEVEEAAQGTCLGDAARVKQIAANLISNAIKFTDAGEVTVRLARCDAGLSLEVTDTGIGFDQEMAAKLFDRFVQADMSINRRFGGTGLGLAITQSLVTLMKGEISVCSTPGRGACFRVTLPLQPECRPVEAAPPPAPALRDTPRDGRAPRVLVAEDNPANQKVLALVLAAAGIEVSLVNDGREALTAWSEAPFDAVLMDMQMPVMDGLSAIREIRNCEALSGAVPTPVLMVTANGMAEHDRLARAAGADGVVVKPYSPAVLVSTLQDLLEDAADDGPSRSRRRSTL